MISSNDFFVTLKLTSGENVIAVLDEEDDEFARLKYPVIIKSIHTMVSGNLVEKMSAAPFCPFSNEIYYNIDKRNILFIKELHQTMVPKYLEIINESERSEEIQNPMAQDDPEAEPTISLEEVNKRIDMLQGIIDAVDARKKKEKEDRFFVEGNETLN